jgi:hypothetical protein
MLLQEDNWPVRGQTQSQIELDGSPQVREARAALERYRSSAISRPGTCDSGMAKGVVLSSSTSPTSPTTAAPLSQNSRPPTHESSQSLTLWPESQ